MNEIPKQAQIILLSRLRENIVSASFPPRFHDDYNRYKENFGYNCYSYAMQLKEGINDFCDIYPRMQYPYNPGYISDTKPSKYSSDSLIEAFLEDCRTLGIYCKTSSLNDTSSEEEYKIGILLKQYEDKYTKKRGFHFIRQNEDLSWSEKRGFWGTVQLVGSIESYPKYDLIKVFKIGRMDKQTTLK